MSKAEDTKAQILAGATSLFARKGYMASGVTELEEATGFGRGIIYYHLKNKEALLFEITIPVVNYISEQGEAIVESDFSPPEKLRLLARAVVAHLIKNADATRVFYRDSIWLTGDHRRQMDLASERFENLFRRLLEQGGSEGTFARSGAIQRMAILGILSSTYLWLDSAGALSVDQVAGELTDFILYGLTAADTDPSGLSS